MAAGPRSSRSSHSWSLLPTRKLDCQVSESIIFMRFSPSQYGLPRSGSPTNAIGMDLRGQADVVQSNRQCQDVTMRAGERERE